MRCSCNLFYLFSSRIAIFKGFHFHSNNQTEENPSDTSSLFNYETATYQKFSSMYLTYNEIVEHVSLDWREPTEVYRDEFVVLEGGDEVR